MMPSARWLFAAALAAALANPTLLASEANPFPTGLIPLADELARGRAERIEWVEAGPARSRMNDLPAAWKNTLHLPVVRRQLLSNCGAFAPSYYYKTYQEARERGWIRPDPEIHPEQVMSPGFTYPLTNGGENSGAGLATVLNVICRYGIATWADLPENSHWWEYPADEVWAKALPYRGDRVIGFNLSTPEGLRSLKEHLVGGDLAVLAVPVSSHLHHYPHGGGTHNEVFYENADIYDWHALTVIGYDDTRVYQDAGATRSGAFLAVNSWGPGWGVLEPEVGTHGFIWLAYDYLSHRRPSDTSALAMIDRLDYTPQELAIIEISHQARSDLQMEIYAGHGWGRAHPLSAFPRHGGQLPFHGTITLDITDFIADHPEVYHLWIMDWEGTRHSPHVGTIGRFEILRADGRIMTNPEVPVTLANSHPEHPPDQWRSTRLTVSTLQPDPRRFWDTPLHTPQFSWVDFNSDGHLDFVVFGTYGATDHHAGLYLNDGRGHFHRQSTGLPALHQVIMAWGDYNHDGYPDLAVSGRTAELELVTLLLRNERGFGLLPSGIPLPQGRMGLAWGDYDQDGDLDLATSTGRLFRNEAGTRFVDSGIALLGGESPPYTSVSWADVNNDGLLDLILNGIININVGGAFGGAFHQDPLNPPTVGGPGARTQIWFWHDFNGDGLLDAVANGVIYYDMGAATDFTNPDAWRMWYEPSEPVLPNWGALAMDAADFNNDGLLDLAMSGMVGSSADVRFSVFRQEPDRYLLPSVPETWAVQTFTDIGLDLAGFYSGNVGWGDWDGDGDLDLLAGGFDSDFGHHLISLASQLTDHGRSNQRPLPPQLLETTVTGDDLLLRWHPAQDPETPQTSLAYEVRVGLRPGGAEVVSPFGLGPLPGNARLIGALNLPDEPVIWPRHKNNRGLPGIRLRQLPAGRYFWSVRTVDTQRARSPWSTEQSFTLTQGGLRTGDLNGDGMVDVADLVRLRQMLEGTLPADNTLADLNHDSRVTQADAIVLANLILGIAADGFLPVAEAEIGPAGGVLSDGLFALEVPSGALSQTAQLQLFVAAEDRALGEGSPPLLWRVEGLPVGMTGTLNVSGPDLRSSPSTPVMLALGQRVRPFGDAQADDADPPRGFMGIPGTIDGGRLHAALPADLIRWAGQPSAGRPARAHARGPASDSSGKFGFEAGWFSTLYTYQTAHFRICWYGLTPGYIPALGAELEAAFSQFKSMAFPFEDKRDWTRYPIQVWLKELKGSGGKSLDGQAVHVTDNGAYLELNLERMQVPELRRTTVYHEFFHLVQGWVNPAYSITEAADKELLLLSEATATWMERFGAADLATYTPPNYAVNRYRVFDGLAYGARVNSTEAGYGFAALIEYLSHEFGESAVKNIYQRIALGDAAIAALFNSVPHPTDRSWHHRFYETLVARQIYPGAPILNLTSALPPEWPPAHHTYTATAEAPARTTFSVHLPGLGATGRRFAFTRDAVTNLTDSSVLAVSLTNPRRDLGLGVVSGRIQADPPGTVDVELYGAKPEILRARVLNLKQALPTPPNDRAPWRSFLAVATRTDPAEPYLHRPSTLKMAVADRLDGDYPIPDFTHGMLWWNNEVITFPEYDISSRLTVADLTGTHGTNLVQSMPGVNVGANMISVFQDGPVSAYLHFQAAPLAPSIDVYAPGSNVRFSRFTRKSALGYQLSKRIYGGPELEQQPYVFAPRPFSGGETLWLDADEDHVNFAVSIRFLVEEQAYEGEWPVGTPYAFESHTTALFIHLKRE